jgi:tetratricopeptide (TPR) repeat protein
MSITLLKPIYDAYYNAVVGLRTGQVGRANQGLAELSDFLTNLIARMEPKDQQHTLPVIREIMLARERNDSASLADILQFALPSALPCTELVPDLLNPEILGDLKALEFRDDTSQSIDLAVHTLRAAFERFPKARGITTYFAAPMLVQGNYTEAKLLLDEEPGSGPENLTVSYLSSLVSAHSGEFQQALRTMKRAYLESATVRDGYARLGNIKARTGDIDGALSIATKDEAEKRLSPPWAIQLALLYGKKGKFARASRLIESAYESGPSLRNGFARLGWMKAEQGEWRKALELMAMDEAQDRITANWQINLAQVYGRQGEYDHASSLIDSAYEADPTLQNGFSRLGWLKAEQQEWDGALQLMARDEALNRITPNWAINLAQLYGRQGRFTHAIEIVLSAYRDDSTLQNGCTRLGWIKAEECQWQEAFQIMVRDEELGRITPNWQINLAQIYGRQGNFRHAETLIQAAYAKDDSLENGFARLGWIYAEKHNWNKALPLMERDQKERRISEKWQSRLDEVKVRAVRH